MYNIDLSFMEGASLDTLEVKEAEEKCNKLFQSKIVENSSLLEKSINADCACADNQTDKVDDRRIVEAFCEGLLGVHYCVIPDGNEYNLQKGDTVIVKCPDSIEISKIVETEYLVTYKRMKCGCAGEDLPYIDRVASEGDLTQYQKNLEDEQKAKPIFLELINKYNLDMKLVNIHYQFDRKKLYFFYTADGRVDFRQLAKDLAGQFRTRIELRQMGVRDEAKQIGGLGTCGREYCCSSFLDSFKRISTQYACNQNLASNLSKLSGPCGKLKCCLSFEVEEEVK